MVKPDQTESMPIEVAKHMYTKKVDVTQPRAMEMTPCAQEGQECAFTNMAVVRYSLG